MNFRVGRVTDGIFQHGECRVEVADVSDGPVRLGVRPEDLLAEAIGPKLAEVTLDVVEHMGHETMVYFDLEGRQQVARLAADVPYRPGDSLVLHLRPDSWHLFADDDEGKWLN